MLGGMTEKETGFGADDKKKERCESGWMPLGQNKKNICSLLKMNT